MAECTYVRERVPGDRVMDFFTGDLEPVARLHARVHANQCRPCEEYLVGEFRRIVDNESNGLYFLGRGPRGLRTLRDADRRLKRFLEESENPGPIAGDVLVYCLEGVFSGIDCLYRRGREYTKELSEFSKRLWEEIIREEPEKKHI